MGWIPRWGSLWIVHPFELLSLAAYVAEDGLLGHHWEETNLDLANFICPSTGKCQGQEVGVGGLGSRARLGECIEDFQDNI